MTDPTSRLLAVSPTFSLRETCAPVCWVGNRSPRHAWIDGALIVVESHGGRPVWRDVRQTGPGELIITSPETGEPDEAWARRVLGTEIGFPQWNDPVIDRLAMTFPGMHPYSDGSLFDGLLTAIIGQSISLASAAAAQRKLAMAFHEGVEVRGRMFYPLPEAAQLAESSVELIRTSGVTWKRAEAVKVIAREQIDGNLPTDEDAAQSPDETICALLALPMVGRWTAESVLLWGIGSPNAHPTNDIALLNAARRAYGRPEMTFRELDSLAERWQPGRALAARLLWTGFFGPAPP